MPTIEQAPSQSNEQAILNQRAAQEDWPQDRLDAAQKALDAKYNSPSLIPGGQEVLAKIDEATKAELNTPDLYAAKIPETAGRIDEASLVHNESIDQDRLDAINRAHEAAVTAAHSIVENKQP